MGKPNVLYQIKSLETMAFRSFLQTSEMDKKMHKKPTPTQINIMECILESGEKQIQQKQLEEILNLRRATVSEVLQTMEKNGLIERVSNPNDTRTKIIRLNESAKNVFQENQCRLHKLEEFITQGIPQGDLETFSRVIDMMKENIKNVESNKVCNQ